MRSLLVAVAFLAFAFTSAGFGQGSSNASDPAACAECRFNFGAVAQGTVVEHQFPLRSDGDQPLHIANVQLTPPLQLARMPAVVPAKGSVMLKLTLNTSKVEGEFSGQLPVMLSEQVDSPRLFSLTLELAAERGPQGDRVQITASLLSAKVAPGPIRGTIQLHTNDPTFPELTVPVTGEIVAD